MDEDYFNADLPNRDSLVKFPFIVAFLLVALGVSVFASSYYNAQYQIQIAQKLSEDQALIMGEFKEIATKQELMDAVTKQIEQVSQNPSAQWNEEVQKILVQNMTSDSDVTDVYLGLASGRIIDGSGWEAPEEYNCTERPWYKKSLESPGKIQSVLYFEEVIQKIVFSRSRPIHVKGELVGVLGVDSQLTTFGELMNSGKLPDKSGIIADSEGRVLLSNMDGFNTGDSLNDKDETVVNVDSITQNKSGLKGMWPTQREAKWMESRQPLLGQEYQFVLRYPVKEIPLAQSMKLATILLVIVFFGVVGYWIREATRLNGEVGLSDN